MSKILVSNSITLDDVFEGPAKSPKETFELAGWAEAYQSEEQNKYLSQGISGGGVLLLGRVTYEHMRAGWAQGSGPVSDFMNKATKYVVSTTLKKPEWQNTIVISGNVAAEVARLKKESGKDMAVLGSGELCRTLREHDLIDEYSLLLFPLVLGRGKKFFDGPSQTPLKLKEARPFSSGVVLLSYEPARK